MDLRSPEFIVFLESAKLLTVLQFTLNWTARLPTTIYAISLSFSLKLSKKIALHINLK